MPLRQFDGQFHLPGTRTVQGNALGKRVSHVPDVAAQFRPEPLYQPRQDPALGVCEGRGIRFS